MDDLGSDPAGTAEAQSSGPQDWATQTEQKVLMAAILRAPRMGWSAQMVRAACDDCQLSLGDQELLLPNGPRDLAALLSRYHDAQAMKALEATPANTLKIRQRIAAGLSARLEAAAADQEAAKKCAGFLALPFNAHLGISLAWESANLIWRWSGDTSTDQNHYSKRMILGGILIPALTIRLFEGKEAADRFCDKRIENVMQFEKWKAGKDFDAPMRKITDFLGRMRYGAKV